MFLCTTIASIFAYFRCNYSYSCSRENETLETIPLNNEGLSLVKIKFPMKNYRIVALNFTALQYINPQRSPKKTFNLRKFNFLKNLSSSWIISFKYTNMFTKSLTRVLRYILIKSSFLAIGWSYLPKIHLWYCRSKKKNPTIIRSNLSKFVIFLKFGFLKWKLEIFIGNIFHVAPNGFWQISSILLRSHPKIKWHWKKH